MNDTPQDTDLKWQVRELTEQEALVIDSSKDELPSCQGGLDNSTGGMGGEDED